MYERALIQSKGATRTISNVMVNAHSHNIYSGNCSNPLIIPHGWFKPGLSHNNFSLINYTKPVVGLDMNRVRCRTCPNCIKAAQYFWYLRAIDEYQASKYSAFGTLTFSERFFSRKWREENSHDVCSTFVDPPAFDERGRQQELRLMLGELTLCLKRMRKAGWSLRYMAVTEFGTEGGRPHVHFVMHLPAGSAPYLDFRKALKKNWEHFPACKCRKNAKGNYVENCRVGWADVRPVLSNHRAAYACKYIGKQRDTVSYDGQVLATSERCRLRASIQYGARVMADIGAPDLKIARNDAMPEATMITNEGSDIVTNDEARRTRAEAPLIGPHLSGHRCPGERKPARVNPRDDDGFRSKDNKSCDPSGVPRSTKGGGEAKSRGDPVC